MSQVFQAAVGDSLLTAGDVASLRAARERALARVHDHAPALVDAFAIPAERLQATIAQDDYVSAVVRELNAS
jgi:acyl-CoA oxidase